MSAQIRVEDPPAAIYWHIYTFGDAEDAAAEAEKHEWSAQAFAHGRNWLYVLGPHKIAVQSGQRAALIGPMQLEPGRPVVARFIESIFPPGMRTRVHSHPGPEGFYVVEGEQCMETPLIRRQVQAGSTFIVPAGPHVQAAPKGRRNIAVVFQPEGEEWMRMEEGWQPSDFCIG